MSKKSIGAHARSIDVVLRLSEPSESCRSDMRCMRRIRNEIASGDGIRRVSATALRLQSTEV